MPACSARANARRARAVAKLSLACQAVMGAQHFRHPNASLSLSIQESRSLSRRGLPSILPRKFFVSGMAYGYDSRSTPEMPAAQSFPSRRRLIFLNHGRATVSLPSLSIPDDSSTCCRRGGRKFALHEKHATAAGPTQTLNPNCPAEFVVYLEKAHGHSAVCDQKQGTTLRSLADEQGTLLPEKGQWHPGLGAVERRRAGNELIDTQKFDRAQSRQAGERGSSGRVGIALRRMSRLVFARLNSRANARLKSKAIFERSSTCF